jgi:hypothetical protein
MTRSATVCLFAALLCVQPAAADKIYVGAGDESCGSWTAARKTTTVKSLELTSWFFGFMSGANLAAPFDILKGTDAEGLLAWTDNYCAHNPLAKIVGAANALGIELITKAALAKIGYIRRARMSGRQGASERAPAKIVRACV